jgi:Domain of unknown function (DUF4145)
MSQNSPDLQKLKQRVRAAVDIAERVPSAAAGELRGVNEILIRDVYHRNKGEPKNPKESLQNLIAPLSKGGFMPVHISECADLVRTIGNRGVHYDEKTTSEAEFVSALQNLLHVLVWYEREYRTPAAAEVARSAQNKDTPNQGGAYHGMTVILAGRQAESDIESDKEWGKIRSSLLDDGVTVVSEAGAGNGGSELQNALFIQLFSTLDSFDETKRQLEKCGLKDDSALVLKWRKPLPNPRIDSQVLESLSEDDKKFCGTNVQTGTITDFYDAGVRGRLQKLKEVAAREQGIANGERRIIYLAYDNSNKKDREYARMLLEVANKSVNVKYPTSVFSERLTPEQKKAFWEELKTISGIVFLYGDTSPLFIGDLVNSYIDGKRLAKPSVKLAALYEAPPGKEEMKDEQPMIGLSPDEWRKYGSREKFLTEDIAKYCAELGRDPN